LARGPKLEKITQRLVNLFFKQCEVNNEKHGATKKKLPKIRPSHQTAAGQERQPLE